MRSAVGSLLLQSTVASCCDCVLGAKMLRLQALLVLLVVIAGAYANEQALETPAEHIGAFASAHVNEQELEAPGEHVRVKRQVAYNSVLRAGTFEFILVTTADADGEIYLVITDSVDVTLTAGDNLLLQDRRLSIAGTISRTFDDIEAVFIDTTGSPPPSVLSNNNPVTGPGFLFVSSASNSILAGRQVAFFTRFAGIANFLVVQRARATPVPPVRFQTIGRLNAMDETLTVLQSQTGTDPFEDRITVSGSTSTRVMSGGGISYFGNTIFVQSPTGVTDQIDGIGGFSVFTGRPPIGEFVESSTQSFVGPGTLYVNDDVAFYTADPFRPGDIDVVGTINQGLIENSVSTEVEGGDTFLADIASGQISRRVVRLNGVASQMFPTAAEIIYNNGVVMIRGPGDTRLNAFGDISRFTLFDNNQFMMVSESSDRIRLSASGGQFYYDGLGNAFFSVNPAISSQVNSLAANVNPPPPQTIQFGLNSNSQGVTTLSQNGMQIITLTGASVIAVEPSQLITYVNGDVRLVDREGNDVGRFGTGINRFTANVAPNILTVFNGSAPRQFQGSGQLYISDTEAFYTTNSMLVSQITSFLNTLPPPTIAVDGNGNLAIGGEAFVDLTEATAADVASGSVVIYSRNVTTIVDAPQSIPSGSDVRVTYANNTVIVFRRETGGGMDVLQRIEGVPTWTVADGFEFLTFSGNSGGMEFPGGGYSFQNAISGNAFYTTSLALTDRIADQVIQNSGNVRNVIGNIGDLGFFDGRRYITYRGSANSFLPGFGMYYFSGGTMFYNTDRGTNEVIVNGVALVNPVTTIRENGFITLNYTGNSIYSFTTGSELTQVTFGPFDTFSYTNGTITGSRIPGSPIDISMLTTFNGITVQNFNSNSSSQEITGGYLIIDRQRGTAFYTTSSQARTVTQNVISQLEETFIRPVIDDSARGERLLKFPTGSAPIGVKVTTYEGVDVTLVCRVLVGNPAPGVQFSYFNTADNTTVVLNATSMPAPSVYHLLLPNVRAAQNQGRYACVATNDVGQGRNEGFLNIRPATAPVFNPNFFPAIPTPRQQIIFSRFEGDETDVILNTVDEVLFPCRFSGRPNPTVQFLENGVPINGSQSIYNISETRPGASVLIVDVTEVTGPLQLDCTGSTPAIPFSASGREAFVNLIRYDCTRTGFGMCPVTCGLGIALALYDCTVTENGGAPSSINFTDVPAGLFPQEQQVCGDGPCPRSVFRFRVDPFEECSVTCGGGLQSRFVACEKRLQVTSADPADINETVVANVSDSNCIRAGRRVPARVQRCNVGVPCPIWIAEPFGLCSCTCGGGLRFRPSVACTLPNGTVIDDAFCAGQVRPADSEPCNQRPCLYAWQADNWSPCDNTFFCQERNVFCVNADRHNPDVFKSTVDDSFCFDTIGQRPHSVRSCGENGYCTQGVWCVGDYSECSVTCGYGQLTRDVFCITRNNSFPTMMFSDTVNVTYPNRIEDGFCDSRSRPQSVRPCFRSCPGVCREIKFCKTVRSMQLCNTELARGCCASCPNSPLAFPTKPPVPVPAPDLYNTTCNSGTLCTLRTNTIVRFCFSIPGSGSAQISIIPSKPATAGDIDLFDPIVEIGNTPPDLTCAEGRTAVTTVRSYPETFTAVASIIAPKTCSLGIDVIQFRILP